MRERLVRLKLQWDRIAKEIGELQNRMAPLFPTECLPRLPCGTGAVGGPKAPQLERPPSRFPTAVHVDSSRPDCADTVVKLEFWRRSQLRRPLAASTENSLGVSADWLALPPVTCPYGLP
jgi:hypothetical protein